MCWVLFGAGFASASPICDFQRKLKTQNNQRRKLDWTVYLVECTNVRRGQRQASICCEVCIILYPEIVGRWKVSGGSDQRNILLDASRELKWLLPKTALIDEGSFKMGSPRRTQNISRWTLTSLSWRWRVTLLLLNTLYVRPGISFSACSTVTCAVT